MKVSRAFLKDFAFVANFYEWDEAKIEEVKAEIRADPARIAHWKRQAALHRQGVDALSAPVIEEPPGSVAQRIKPTPCMGCVKFSLKGSPEAAEGRGRCLALPSNVSLHIEKSNHCANFKAAPADQVEQRRIWWLQKRDTQK